MSPRICILPAVTALALSGCGGTTYTSSAEHSKHQTAHRRDVAALYQHPQRAQLALRAGRATASYRITAPSPAHYGFNVTAMLPTSSNVSLRIETTPGRYLSIFSSRHGDESCKSSQAPLGGVDCFGRYPLLASEPGGHWTVVASKSSGPAATAHVAVAFELYKPYPKPIGEESS